MVSIKQVKCNVTGKGVERFYVLKEKRKKTTQK